MAGDDFDPLNRELCPDGTCIGLIGPDGRCKVCGTPGVSSVKHPRERNLRSEEEVAAELEAHIQTGDIAAAPGDIDDRRLCPDGACIGLIGPDGRCTECGAEADSSADSEADSGADSEADSEVDSPGGLEVEGDLADRELCPDGGCIGLIGPDGRCKECGTPSRGQAPGS